MIRATLVFFILLAAFYDQDKVDFIISSQNMIEVY